MIFATRYRILTAVAAAFMLAVAGTSSAMANALAFGCPAFPAVA